MDNRVSVARCPDYQAERLDQAVAEALAPLGGIGRFVKPGQKVFLKCNLLMKRRPETATTTHPALVEAVVRQVQQVGGIAILGDSPGGPFTPKSLQGIYDTCGLTAVAEHTGCQLNFDCSSAKVHFPDGRTMQHVPLIKAAREADVLINLPKLKTHGITLITAAVKNLYGLIPGLTKIEYHLRLPDHQHFSSFLVDLCRLVQPDLTILDAVYGMEGHGPSGGNPIAVGAVAASPNPFALDVVAATLAGVKPERVTTVAAAKQMGLHSGLLQDVQLLGSLDGICRQFATPQLMPRADFLSRWLPRSLAERITRWASPRPVFIPEVCVGCGVCVNSCPPQALSGASYPPQVDLRKCIRCFCCQEMCPAKAIKVQQPPVTRLFFGRHSDSH
ncbi:MAG: DUF362 domain-containing protein [Bacillota bacterium]|jgi:uncharacterized protein (DUF362 family)/Pyruvate/2-oxoacid:ferredoxin oxidoreductase delta subunit